MENKRITKYIDAEKAILEIEKHIRTGDEIYLLQIHEKWCNEGLQLATDIIYNQPSADVIEVVRCKDCKYNPIHSFTGCPMAEIEKRQPTDYCSYGEHKNE